MNRGTSLYLDVVRFSAAMVVFLGHAAGQSFTGGLLWQLGSYLQTAVIVFFVLSGYVIAHVLNGRENTVLDYATARAARLYSIVIPALILTAICDRAGLAIDPAFYHNGPWPYPEGNQAANYFASLFFINHFWGWELEPGINVPFWSLSSEAVYYVAAGLVFFTKGITRIALIALIFAAAGPTIAALAPIWALGFGIYKLTQKVKLSPIISWCLAVGGLALLVLRPEMREGTTITNRNFVADYLEAGAFAVHLIGIHGLAIETTLNRFQRPIRWAGSLTFALYLFHRPLIQILAVLNVGAPESWQQRAYLLGLTFLIVATLGAWCETRKGTLRRALTRRTPRPDLAT